MRIAYARSQPRPSGEQALRDHRQAWRGTESNGKRVPCLCAQGRHTDTRNHGRDTHNLPSLLHVATEGELQGRKRSRCVSPGPLPTTSNTTGAERHGDGKNKGMRAEITVFSCQKNKKTKAHTTAATAYLAQPCEENRLACEQPKYPKTTNHKYGSRHTRREREREGRKEEQAVEPTTYRA